LAEVPDDATSEPPPVDDYGSEAVSALQIIWGDGFMSPGGPAEVTRTLAEADLRGTDVLDVGCGIGGADLVLVRDHGAASVTGVDVQQNLLDIAAQRAREAGVDRQVRYRRVEPGPLPFADASFAVVFSKDAILHVEDKAALYAETFRVLRPGGLLRVSDWLRGGPQVDDLVAELVEEAGHDFRMCTLAESADLVSAAGYADVQVEDRNAWYLAEAQRELADLTGPGRAAFVDRFGEERTGDEIHFWEVLVRSLERGALRPGHIRARKP
jgi:phosphoethanolamine N-methyltransferase